MEHSASQRDKSEKDRPPPLVDVSSRKKEEEPPRLERFIPNSQKRISANLSISMDNLSVKAEKPGRSSISSDRRQSFDPRVLDSSNSDPKVKLKLNLLKKSGEDLKEEEKKKKAQKTSAREPEEEEIPTGELPPLRERSFSFDALRTSQDEGGASHHGHAASASMSIGHGSPKKPVISGPSSFRHIETRSALHSSKAIPHRFNSYSFTSIKNPKCSYCGIAFKGLRHKAYKCSECQYLCHPRCLPSVPADCGLRSETMKSSTSTAAILSPRSSKIFGVELTKQLEIEGGKVPKIVEVCVAAVEKRGMDLEGVYRVSGITSQINRLREAFNTGSPNLEDPEWSDITVVTSVLKQYLRELPISLIIPDTYETFMNLMKTEGEPERIEGIRKAIELLPPEHQVTLAFIVRHLGMVDKSSSINKMTSYNLSLLFGPTLMRGKDPMKDLEDMQEQAKVIEHLIVHHEKLFS